MGNNTSAPLLRKRSISREYKSSSSHREYREEPSSPIKIKKLSVGGTQSAPEAYNDDPFGPAKEQHQQSIDIQPQSLVEQETHNRVATPNIFLGNYADQDYFSRDRQNAEQTENANEPNSDDLLDDDEYGIDEDLVTTPAIETDDTKKVFIKYNKSSSDFHGQYSSVYVVGSFNHWTEKFKLEPHYGKDDTIQYYKIQINLPIGIYRIKFLVDGEIKYSNHLPIATDKSGNVVNWFEVDNVEPGVFEAGTIEHPKITSNKRKSSISFWNDSTSSIGRSHSALALEPHKEKHEYSQDIPDVYQANNEEILPADEDFLVKNPIPDLPVYLNNNYLNKYFHLQHQNNSSLDAAHNRKSVQGLKSHIIPHVNLNHLLTSNIKYNVLSVACTTRYSGKFVTQIMYSPSDYEQ